MRKKKITITVTDDDLKNAGFDTTQISNINFHRVVSSIEIGLKISLLTQAVRAKHDHWWLPRLTD